MKGLVLILETEKCIVRYCSEGLKKQTLKFAVFVFPVDSGFILRACSIVFVDGLIGRIYQNVRTVGLRC